MFKNSEKLISKFYRLKFRDKIKEMLDTLPVLGLKENQTGNFIYSGVGFISMFTSIIPVSVKIKITEGEPYLFIEAPKAGVFIKTNLWGDVERLVREKNSKIT